jgi:hypothetical protein
MSQSLFTTARFDLPHVTEDDKLHRLLSAALKSRIGHSSPSLEGVVPIYWNSSYFGLDRVKIFQESTPEEQQQILHRCNQALLEEAYFVEKAGVGYMAKMVRLAETTEEQMLYGLFAADEATHLAQLRPFLGGCNPVATGDRFLGLLAEIVEMEDKPVLVFMIQVVLEGWGLSHYRSLAQDCCDRQLGNLFRGFLDAEARHHSTGVTLCDRLSLTPSSQGAIVEALTSFLRMVQVGPQRVVQAIAQVKGDLSRPQQIKIFQELDTETHSGTRLQLLRSLLRSDSTHSIMTHLENQGSFIPFIPEHCVI